MNPDVADQSSSKGRWIKLAVLCGVPLLLAASFLLWYIGRQARAQAQVNLAIADLRASGLPVDNRSLTEFYQSLTDDRRTAQWLGIFGQLETFNTSERARSMPAVGLGGDVPLPGSPWSQQREVEAFLQSQQSLLADLHDAASEPMTVWFPIEFNSDETIIPHYPLSRTAARLLLLEHHAAVYAGDGQRAAQSLRSLIGLAETIRAEPILASQVTARAVQGVALGAVKRSIEHDVLNEDSLARLLEWLDFFDDYRTPFRTAIVGERAMHLPILQEPRKFDDDLFFVFGSRARDVLASLGLYERLEQLTEEEDLAAFVQSAQQLSNESEAEFEAAGLLQKYETLATHLHKPPFSAVAEAFARLAVDNRQAKLGVGLRLYRRRFQEWPPRLDELNEVGLDAVELVPLGSNPFGYRIEKDTALLWGIAWDTTAPWQVPEDPPEFDERDQTNAATWQVWRLPP